MRVNLSEVWPRETAAPLPDRLRASRVVRYRSLGAENRLRSATPRKLTQAQSLGAVTKNHCGNRRERQAGQGLPLNQKLDQVADDTQTGGRRGKRRNGKPVRHYHYPPDRWDAAQDGP